MRSRKTRLAVVLGTLVLVAGMNQVRADDVYGTIRGMVADPSGAVVPGATIAVRNVATGIVRTVSTNADGTYEVLNLPAPATYQVSVEMAGFKPFEATGLSLALNQIYVLDVRLELGQATQRVTVEAAPPRWRQRAFSWERELPGRK